MDVDIANNDVGIDIDVDIDDAWTQINRRKSQVGAKVLEQKVSKSAKLNFLFRPVTKLSRRVSPPPFCDPQFGWLGSIRKKVGGAGFNDKMRWIHCWIDALINRTMDPRIDVAIDGSIRRSMRWSID